jgi:hypothetical protein
MWHTLEGGKKCRGFWWESPKERDHLKDQDIDKRMGLEWILGDWLCVCVCVCVWSGFTLFIKGTDGWLL